MPLDPRLQMTEYFFLCHIDFEAFDHATPRRRVLQRVRSREFGAFFQLRARSMERTALAYPLCGSEKLPGQL
jgi:hypothetical protein